MKVAHVETHGIVDKVDGLERVLEGVVLAALVGLLFAGFCANSELKGCHG